MVNIPLHYILSKQSCSGGWSQWMTGQLTKCQAIEAITARPTKPLENTRFLGFTYQKHFWQFQIWFWKLSLMSNITEWLLRKLQFWSHFRGTEQVFPLLAPIPQCREGKPYASLCVYQGEMGPGKSPNKHNYCQRE